MTSTYRLPKQIKANQTIMTTSMPKFTPNELVWYEEGGQIHSAGYKVESLFKTLGIAPMTTMNAPVMSGGNANVGEADGDASNVSDLFRFMGVPAGLSSVIGSDVSKTREVMTGGGDDADVRRTEGGLIPSSLFDKLVKLAGPEDDGKDIGTNVKGRKRNTRKRGGKKVSSQSGKKRKTRKHRD
jgi:hypothetical protein